jgi:hypothetical protein
MHMHLSPAILHGQMHHRGAAEQPRGLDARAGVARLSLGHRQQPDRLGADQHLHPLPLRPAHGGHRPERCGDHAEPHLAGQAVHLAEHGGD